MYSVKRSQAWFPGAGFKLNAAIWKKKMEEFADKPYEFASRFSGRLLYLQCMTMNQTHETTLLGMECNFAFERYGDHWRLARQMIVNMIDDPAQYAFHYSTFSAAVAMSVYYDYESSPRNDPMVHIVHRFLQASMPAMTAKKVLLLKMFPFSERVLHIPDWLPGSSIKREARTTSDLAIKMVEIPYQYAKGRTEAKQQLTLSMRRSDYTKALKYASATAILGVIDRQVQQRRQVPYSRPLLAMVENPHVWKRV
ncbi:hypothetical protein PAXINDRAFT_102650 [Paxillus involutus ATCC 200175]|uniref:Uncharacterized protein n=1 Tax=Paxillus involutus ATCC 200175 TaxID=664439 RepID=A0A0C9TB07_PAXIN|nr:hypothetical protein PAXINDRAFT_102650 [Paxillus involutus ATCC 200175]